MAKSKFWFHCRISFIIVFVCTTFNDSCVGAKLERKQDFFDVDSFDSKRDYKLNEIGKRGFTSTLGYDYSGSSEYGIGASSVVTSSDYSNARNGGGDDTMSPARDLIPPPAPGVYSSSTSPPSTRSDYTKYGRISPPSTTKDFHSNLRRSQISRRSPQLRQTSLSSYFDEISSNTGGSRGRSLSSGSYGLVADNEGKLIGYAGSYLPGYTESPPSIVTSSTASISPDPSNFVGSYFPNSHSTVSTTDFGKPKFGLASSATSGSYTSTPVYYPGREEDHTYRMRDTTSQGYEDEESNPSLEDNDFTIGGSMYQPSPIPPPPANHYRIRENDGMVGHTRYLGTSRFLPYSRSGDLPGFSYGPVGKSHTRGHNHFSTKRAYGSSSSNHGNHGGSSHDRVIPYSYTPLSYGEYGSG